MTEQDSYNNPELERLFQRYEEAPKSHIFAPLADACRKAGRLDEAVAICQEGLERHPEYASGHVVLGKCFYDQGQMDRAYGSFRRVLEMDTENLVALKYIGMILAEKGEMEEARKHFNRILALDPDNREIVEKLGSLEEPDEILDLAPIEDERFEGEEIVVGEESLETPDELATVTLADIFASQGYKNKARKIYHEVLDRDPGNESVKRKLETLNETNSALQNRSEDPQGPVLEEQASDEFGETWDGGIPGEAEGASEADGGSDDRTEEASPPSPSPAARQPRSRARTASKTREHDDEADEIADEKSFDQFKRWLKNADR